MTKEQTKREGSANRSYRVSIWAVIIPAIISIGSLGYTVLHDRHTDRSFGERLGRLETSVRVLTATTAPQLQHEIDESLRAALLSPPAERSLMVSHADERLRSLQELRAPISLDTSKALASTVEGLLKDASDSAASWEIAANLITYRSGYDDSKESLKNCFSETGKPSTGHLYDPQPYHDCVLDLGDFDGYRSHAAYLIAPSPDGKRVSGVAAIRPSFDLERVIVKIPSGQLIPFDKIRCRDCQFDVAPRVQIPDTRGQNVLRMLLASDGKNAEITDTET